MNRLFDIPSHRAPDFLIGPREDPYMRRWWVIPRNNWFNIYLHEIRHSDDDRALHDHPWWNLSIILRGGYLEETPGPNGSRLRKTFRAGAVRFRFGKQAHRLEVRDQSPCWTLFITGPRFRQWGFCCPKGWVVWTEFVDQREKGQVGRGCGEMS